MGAAFKDFETLKDTVAHEGLKTSLADHRGGWAGVELPPVLAAALQTYQEALDMGLAEEHKGAPNRVTIGIHLSFA